MPPMPCREPCRPHDFESRQPRRVFVGNSNSDSLRLRVTRMFRELWDIKKVGPKDLTTLPLFHSETLSLTIHC